jgi:hypothetical protein
MQQESNSSMSDNDLLGRHPDAGRRRFSTDEGLVIQQRSRLHRPYGHWIPAYAGMTSKDACGKGA